MNEFLFIVLMVASFGAVLLGATRGLAGLQCVSVALALTSTVIAGKIVPLWGLSASCGTAVFTALFLAIDLIAESHGKKAAYRTIQFTFTANLVLLGLGLLVTRIQEAEATATGQALNALFSWLPRLLLGGLAAFLVSQFIDVAVFLLLKRATRGRHLWLRTSGSTVISQAVDTILVWHIAFFGIIENLWSVILVAYVTKLVAALLEAPFAYVGRALNPEANRARPSSPSEVQETNSRG